MSVRDLFDAVADRYDEGARESRYVGPEWLASQLVDVPTPRRALDLGCANGSLGAVMRHRYPTVELVGVDVSPKMIAAAEARRLYSELYVADLEQPLNLGATARFGVVVALGFLEFLSSPASLLSEVRPLLEPGALFFTSFQQHWPERPELAPRRTRSGGVPHHAHTEGEVKQLLSEAGFSIAFIKSEIGYVSRSGFSCPYLFCRCES